MMWLPVLDVNRAGLRWASGKAWPRRVWMRRRESRERQGRPLRGRHPEHHPQQTDLHSACSFARGCDSRGGGGVARRIRRRRRR